MDGLKKDDRFAQIAKDPRFRHMKKQERKVKIDQRFKGMFKDKNFKVKYSVDKRGRPIHATTNENLRRYYELSSSEESSEEEEDGKKKKEKKKNKLKKINDKTSAEDIKSEKTKKGKAKQNKLNQEEISENRQLTGTKLKVNNRTKKDEEKESEPEEDEEEESEPEEDEEKESEPEEDEEESNSEESGTDDDDDDEGIDVKGGPDYARGEGLVESSSDESDAEEEEADDEIEHKWGELDHDARRVEEATTRLAVCNMDWDRIKANDLLVLFNSFKPPGGVIKSVTIYPSEFGLKRMKEEDMKGPPELVEGFRDADSSVKEDDGEEYHREKLRQYQLNRLKYYYAVVVCDSAKTGGHIYDECDGLEYESSATKIDLRFIPEDMTFDAEPKSEATNMPDSSTYKPSQFSNTALQQSKVSLTWDETDPDRVTFTQKTFKKEELEQMDVKAYLASSSEGEEDPYGDFLEEPLFGDAPQSDSDDETRMEKYKELMNSVKHTDDDKQDNDVAMEISWDPSLKESTIDMLKEKEKKEEMTVWDQYLEKKKEKKKRKGEKHNKTTQQQDDQEEAEELSDDDLPSGVDLNDPYFKEELDKDTQVTKPGSKSDKKKKKKGKKDVGLTEEEKKNEAELELLMMDEDDNRQHFNLDTIMEQETSSKKKKKKLRKKKEETKKVEDNFKVDVADPRFADLYKNPLYNIDPSAPEYKATKSTEALVQEKLKRRKTGGVKRKYTEESVGNDVIENVEKDKRDKPFKKDSSLSNLVKSVKAKTKTLHDKKKVKKH